jgi:hypothetical protein
MAESREPLVLQIPAKAIEREPSKGESESKATDLPKKPTGKFLAFHKFSSEIGLKKCLLLLPLCPFRRLKIVIVEAIFGNVRLVLKDYLLFVSTGACKKRPLN